MRFIFFFVLSICFLGCNKPNPNPEKLDPIYADLQKRYAEFKKMADEEKKTMTEHEKTLKEVKPQTGQIKYAEKRYYESRLRAEKLEQMTKYFELRIESRLKYVKSEYMKAWNKKEPWPNPKEYEEYLVLMQTQNKKLNWDAKDRILKYQESVQTSKKAPSSH